MPYDYDIICIGGGIAGAALAKAMAQHGVRVLVIEAEASFRDRVRGEAIMPWGVAEARELGLYDTLLSAGAHQLPWFDLYMMGNMTGHRDLLRTTQQKAPVLGVYHPQMQQRLLDAAAEAGAEVRRGVRVTHLEPSDAPSVTLEQNGRETHLTARLVAAADGRASLARAWAGLEVHRDPDGNLVAGVLLDGITAPDEDSHLWLNPTIGASALLFPQGHGRARAYVCYPAASGLRLSDSRDLPRFLEMSQQCGAPAEYYANVTAAGPLATFPGAAAVVNRPYRQGVALIGDAAFASDPTWGQGLSLSLRDARVLRDQLLRFEDWHEAGEAYAAEHQRYATVLHAFESWETQVMMHTGPEADALRQRVFPLWGEDRTRIPDVLMSGPDVDLGDAARRRFFGEE